MITFRNKYLCKFNHLVDRDDGLDVDMYIYNIIDKEIMIDYYPRENKFFLVASSNNKRELSINDVIRLLNIFEEDQLL
jgi:hypothetical protein